ncbi:Ycf33 family protein [Senna tora]|uniref:Ycf33 family protein n=1 Tax=Senna tora TaxID=362788 RepID=A0A835CGC1_9FABA|nr:Ycf33 family protein [Senna tora]
MKILSLRSQPYILNPTNSSSSPFFLKPIKISSHLKSPKHPPTTTTSIISTSKTPINILNHHSFPPELEIPVSGHYYSDNSRMVIMGAVSLGIFLVLIGMDDHQKALALGPEGPLMEEFWDNVRRYALYALTLFLGVESILFLKCFLLWLVSLSSATIMDIEEQEEDDALFCITDVN